MVQAKDVEVFLELLPSYYTGNYPTVTIHYRPQDKDYAMYLKSLLEDDYHKSEIMEEWMAR